MGRVCMVYIYIYINIKFYRRSGVFRYYIILLLILSIYHRKVNVSDRREIRNFVQRFLTMVPKYIIRAITFFDDGVRGSCDLAIVGHCSNPSEKSNISENIMIRLLHDSISGTEALRRWKHCNYYNNVKFVRTECFLENFFLQNRNRLVFLPKYRVIIPLLIIS